MDECLCQISVNYLTQFTVSTVDVLVQKLQPLKFSNNTPTFWTGSSDAFHLIFDCSIFQPSPSQAGWKKKNKKKKSKENEKKKWNFPLRFYSYWIFHTERSQLRWFWRVIIMPLKASLVQLFWALPNGTTHWSRLKNTWLGFIFPSGIRSVLRYLRKRLKLKGF